MQTLTRMSAHGSPFVGALIRRLVASSSGAIRLLPIPYWQVFASPPICCYWYRFRLHGSLVQYLAPSAKALDQEAVSEML